MNDDLEERDIGDFHTARLSTAFSDLQTPSSQSTPNPAKTPKKKPAPLDGLGRTPSSVLRQQQQYALSASPSSPDFNRTKFVKRPSRTLSRSHTLPRIPVANADERVARRRNSAVDDLITDGETARKINRWVTGIALVDFDLDIGPIVSGVCPPVDLPDSCWENMAFSSIPDYLQTEQGAQVHSIRIRRGTEGDYIYGYSHFSQERDADSKRGYRQRSVVILTEHPYPVLFGAIASTLGPLSDEHGPPMLETAIQNIATWPDPTPGVTLELGFLGSVFNVTLPHGDDELQLEGIPGPDAHYPNGGIDIRILASAPPLDPPPLALFEASVSHLWSIWECLVLCEPLLVFGTTPAQTSQAIWWFRDLLRPIPLASDIRPYFTIQDQDHASLVNKLPPKAGLLLGVTNPFFERSCAHWPHVLSLGAKASKRDSTALSKNFGVSAGPEPGWKTKTHKRYISKDRTLLAQLEEACRGGQSAKTQASALLRQHFSARTAALLVPLNRYLNTLIPLPSTSTTSNSSTSHTRLKPFSTTDFFQSLKTHGATLPFRSTTKRTEFYERWLKSPSFGAWLARQDGIVRGMLKERERQRQEG